MMYSDGLAARLLAKNLIRALKEVGAIDEAHVKKIYDDSIGQLASAIAKLEAQSGECGVPEQTSNPSPDLEELGLDDVNLDLWKSYLEEALDILLPDPDYKK
jgi:hypothetical protein